MNTLYIEKRRQLLKALALSPLISLPNISFAFENEIPPLESLKNLKDFEKYSCYDLDDGACDFLNGGADDLLTVVANDKAYDQYRLSPSYLVDVSTIDTSVTLFEKQLNSPVLLSPVGLNALFNERGELACAKAASNQGNMMIASHMTSFSFEEITKAYGSDIWFQMYMTGDRSYNLDLLRRVESTGCNTIFLTVDVPTGGNREGHQGYLSRIAQSGDLYFGNFSNGLVSTVTPSLTWKDVDWLKSSTNMNVVLKGILSAEDARIAEEHEVSGIMVSNHGGRQLETNRGTIECLPEIKDVIGDGIPVIIDGGIRRGTDVIKALALGANAVAIGRPFVWGLALYGEQGVGRVLSLLNTELKRDMMLLGTPKIDQINKNVIK